MLHYLQYLLFTLSLTLLFFRSDFREERSTLLWLYSLTSDLMFFTLCRLNFTDSWFYSALLHNNFILLYLAADFTLLWILLLKPVMFCWIMIMKSILILTFIEVHLQFSFLHTLYCTTRCHYIEYLNFKNHCFIMLASLL